MSTAERIAWGLLSFIALIVWLRWEGTPRRIKRKMSLLRCRRKRTAKHEIIEASAPPLGF